MSKYLLIIPSILLLSCGGSEEPEEVDFNQWAGSTGLEDTDTVANDLVSPTDTLFSMYRLISKMKTAYDTLALHEFHPIDRFNFSSSRKVKFSGKEQVPYGKTALVTPTAEFYYYSFTDSNKTISAFYNYLDIMAEEGEGGPVKLNQDVEAIKTPPMFMLVYDTIIVSAKYLCEHEKNNWNAFQDSILKVYGKDYKYQIDVDCGGPLKWK